MYILIIFLFCFPAFLMCYEVSYEAESEGGDRESAILDRVIREGFA